MIAFLWNFGISTHCYCGGNVKYGPLSKQLLQRKQQYGAKKFQGNDKLLEKVTSSSYHKE